MKKISILLMGFLILTGCSQAGPILSSIRRDKKGDIRMEKCMMEHNALTGAISLINCSETIL